MSDPQRPGMFLGLLGDLPEQAAEVFQALEKEANWKAAVAAIQQPRSDFQLLHFVVNQHDTDPRRWKQLVLELGVKLRSLERNLLLREDLLERLQGLEQAVARAKPSQEAALRRQLRRGQLDLEDLDLSLLGEIREARALWRLWKKFDKTYTPAELEAGEEEYWLRRIDRQVQLDSISQGRPGPGNLEALWHMRKLSLEPSPDLTKLGVKEAAQLTVLGETDVAGSVIVSAGNDFAPPPTSR